MESRLSTDLYDLTEAISKIDPEVVAHGFLGGEFGYGAYFENDVFEMRPFYWGDCECGFDESDWQWSEENDHADTCYQKVRVRRGWISYDEEKFHNLTRDQIRTRNEQITRQVCKEMGLDPYYGSEVHCTCSYWKDYRKWRSENDHHPACRIVAPNFLHKRTGFWVKWYKYIGRSMEWDESITKEDWREVYNECMDSLKGGTNE